MARKKSAESTIVLKDSVGIEQAASIKKQLLDTIKNEKTVLLDLSQVTDIDSSIIQLILAAKNEADKTEKEFYITGTIPADVTALLAMLSVSFPVKGQEA